jgi:hypothetical protein
MDVYGDLLAIENETLDDVQAMKETYAEIEEDELRRRLVGLANVHTAERFDLDVPGGAYERMATALEDDEAWAEVAETDWYRTAQAMADDWDFFHWKLEFPEVFYDEEGEQLEKSGFDAVIGNPPYVRIYGDTLADTYVEYLRRTFEAAHMKFDLYVVFSEKGINLTSDEGLFSYIIPDKFISTPYGEPLRNQILSDTTVMSVLDLREHNVFDEASVSNLVPVLRKYDSDTEILMVKSRTDAGNIETTELPLTAVVSDEDSSFRLSRSVADMKLTEKIREISIHFDDIFYTNWGLRTGTKEKTEKYVVSETDDPGAHSMIRGHNVVEPYRLRPPSEYIVYEPDNFYNPMFPELFENEKIVFRKISGEGLMAVADENEYYCFSTLIPCVNIQHVENVDRSGIPNPTRESELYDNMYYPLGIVNSTLMRWFYEVNLSDDLSVVPGHINELPIAEIKNISETSSDKSESLIKHADSIREGEGDAESLINSCSDLLEESCDRPIHDLICHLSKSLTNLHEQHETINLDLLDYVTAAPDHESLDEMGRFQPPETASTDSVLYDTADDRENLRVGTVSCERAGAESIIIYATARYKPDDPDAHETDQYGYTETDPIEAFRLTGLTDLVADLAESFVPVAAEEAGGFADFRETATQTNSLVDRLKALTLPDPDRVEGDLRNYLDAKQRAEELDEQIRRTDELIDEIVYELYGLTDEEIAIVEEAVGD